MKTDFNKPLVALVVLASFFAMGFTRDDQNETVKTKPRQCVDMSNLSTRMVLSPDTLLLQDASGHAAKLKMSAPCSQMDDLDMIGFEINGGSQLCSRTDIKVIHSRFDGPQVRCIINEVTFLNRDEARALVQKQ